MLCLARTKKSSPFKAADPWFDGVLAQNVLRRLSGVLDKILLDHLSDFNSQLDPQRVPASTTQHALLISCTEEIASPGSAIEHAAGCTCLVVVLGLGQKEGGVETLLSHQVIVRSLLDDLASVNDKNPVGHFYGRQPVAD